jgi:hypothetical protein
MTQSGVLETALCLASPDLEALIQGRIIAIIPRNFINPGIQFALYPTHLSISSLPLERYYRSSFLSTAQRVFADSGCEIKAWARCESCAMHLPDSFEALSRLTIWTKEALQQALGQRRHIFLAYLRVYLLGKPSKIRVQTQGYQFVPLSSLLAISEAKPVLNDRIFALRKHQLETRQSPPHRELEDLHSVLASLITTSPAAKQLDHDIRVFLNWSSQEVAQEPDSDLSWIQDIAALGDRSIELEEKKSTYQAGTDFENITRRSLEFLGFKVESAHKGGAGGLDLFCSQPYPLVGECKAGKLIPSGTVHELIKLGGMHLGAAQFLNSAKLVIAPGNPSSDMLKAAKEWKVSIINAMTLQKLVELKAKYPGAINLIELKPYLESGQIDYRIDEYINKIEQQIHLRSHIVQVVKKYLQDTDSDNAGVESLRAYYFGSKPPQPLKTEEIYEILLELSSPLTGYLGRVKEKDWKSDRFYFLRDLPIRCTEQK